MHSIFTTLRRWGNIALVSLVVLMMLSLTWGNDAARPAIAQDGGAAGFGGPRVDFSIAAAAIPQACDTNTPPKKCRVEPGDTFTLDVYLKDISELPDKGGPTGGGYIRVGVRLDYSWDLAVASVLTAPPASPCFNDGDSGTFKQIDVFPDLNQFYVFCAASETQYTGLLFSVDFDCPNFKRKETITLVHGPDINWEFGPFPNFPKITQFGTYVLNENGAFAVDGASGLAGSETLIVNCDNFFPWDIPGDDESAPNGVVNIQDIVRVVNHFNEFKPVPGP